MRGDLDSGKAGVGLDYEHRLTEKWSAFGEAGFWKNWGISSQLEYEAIFGTRVRF
jgi:hypothetical protein